MANICRSNAIPISQRRAVAKKSCFNVENYIGGSSLLRRYEREPVTEITFACQCNAVHIVGSGRPVVRSACYCSDCQAASKVLASGGKVPPLAGSDGGTRVVLFRKDRVSFSKGCELLVEARLQPDSATRRVVASCCRTPMFLEFTKGHWISLYANATGAAPPIEMRTMTKHRPAGAELPTDVPNYTGFGGRFMARLLWAWVKMGFRSPKMPTVKPIDIH